MITWEIHYEQTYSREELKPIQMMILNDADFDEILDACEKEDFNFMDEAYIDLAVQFGWDVNKYVEDILEDQANCVLAYDGETSRSLSEMMSNAAIEYVTDYLMKERSLR